MIHQGRLTVGELLACVALLSQLYQPIVRLTGAQAMLSATLVAVNHIVEVLDEPEVRANGPDSRRIHRPRGRLVYRDVSFAYPAAGRRASTGSISRSSRG